ncbi:MAG: rRNA maturation RNase YbeY [Firmicutes bacterium HGW-Firmicutes-11]|nr:MAG: rRNA maturation RNase YbeY [Firmicutes bacterium HGW-Firmicutes-11]
MDIQFSEERKPGDSIIEKMHGAAELLFREESLPSDRISISVTFVDSKEIMELNRIYRDKDQVTDVLSFPQFSDQKDLPDEGPILLGDVVICTEQALMQAEEYGHSAERELVYLFVHSLLHLLGHAHDTAEEKSIMREKEEQIMSQLGLERQDQNDR